MGVVPLEPPPSSTELAPTSSGLSPNLRRRLEDASRFVREGSHAASTRRKYAEDFEHFVTWCQRQGLPSLPSQPGVVALYVHALAEPDADNPPRSRRNPASRRGRQPSEGPLHPSTITRIVAAIRYAHQQAGHDLPTLHPAVQGALRAARRTLGVAPRRRVQAAASDIIRRLVQGLGKSELRHLRDRALLTLGFAGAFRRAALVALDLADLVDVPDGFEVRVRRDKTDQVGVGRTLTIARGDFAETCPVRALEAWVAALRQRGHTEGALFRFIDRHGNIRPHYRAQTEARLSPQAVAEIVKRRARSAGLDASMFAGHSLRAGYVTSAARAGKSLPKIMEQTGHRNANTVMVYVREADRWRDPPSRGIGI